MSNIKLEKTSVFNDYGRQTIPHSNQLSDKSRQLTQLVLYIPWVCIVFLLFLQAQFTTTIENYGFIPLLAGIIFLGLPHGALDHLVPTRVGFKWAQRPLGVLVYLATYIVVASLFFLLWLWQPTIAFTTFLVASILHWGHGDLRFQELFLDRSKSNFLGASVSILLRGSLPILLPILAFPETAESLFHNMSTGLGLDYSITIVPAVMTIGKIFLLCLVIAYFINALAVSYNLDTLLIDVLEIILLAMLFTSIPAYFSVGFYFLFWHSLRHLFRLLLLRSSDRQLVAQGNWIKASLKLTKDLIPVTVIALSFLGFLYFYAESRVTTTESFIALYLILISALTMPHWLLVSLMDQKPTLYLRKL